MQCKLSRVCERGVESLQRGDIQVADHTCILVSLAKQASVCIKAEHVICPNCPLLTYRPTLLRRGAWCCLRTTLMSWSAS